MRADMRSKITVRQLQTGYDPEGEPMNDWKPVEGLTNLWASKEPLLGNDFCSGAGPTRLKLSSDLLCTRR